MGSAVDMDIMEVVIHHSIWVEGEDSRWHGKKDMTCSVLWFRISEEHDTVPVAVDLGTAVGGKEEQASR